MFVGDSKIAECDIESRGLCNDAVLVPGEIAVKCPVARPQLQKCSGFRDDFRQTGVVRLNEPDEGFRIFDCAGPLIVSQNAHRPLKRSDDLILPLFFRRARDLEADHRLLLVTEACEFPPVRPERRTVKTYLVKGFEVKRPVLRRVFKNTIR